MALPWEAIKHYSKNRIFLALENLGLFGCSNQCLLFHYAVSAIVLVHITNTGNEKTMLGYVGCNADFVRTSKTMKAPLEESL